MTMALPSVVRVVLGGSEIATKERAIVSEEQGRILFLSRGIPLLLCTKDECGEWGHFVPALNEY